MQQQTFQPGQKLFRQDEKARHLYIIKQGIAKCYITEENTKDYILEFFGEGEVMGELELLTGTSILSTVEAVTDLVVYKTGSAHFLQLLETNPTLNKLILKELATRVRQLAVRVSYQQLYPVEYTLLKLLSLFSYQELPLSKKTWPTTWPSPSEASTAPSNNSEKRTSSPPLASTSTSPDRNSINSSKNSTKNNHTSLHPIRLTGAFRCRPWLSKDISKCPQVFINILLFTL